MIANTDDSAYLAKETYFYIKARALSGAVLKDMIKMLVVFVVVVVASLAYLTSNVSNLSQEVLDDLWNMFDVGTKIGGGIIGLYGTLLLLYLYFQLKIGKNLRCAKCNHRIESHEVHDEHARLIRNEVPLMYCKRYSKVERLFDLKGYLLPDLCSCTGFEPKFVKTKERPELVPILLGGMAIFMTLMALV